MLKLIMNERFISTKNLPSEFSDKVFVSLVNHVYSQTNVAMVASLFCAFIVFSGLFSVQESNVRLLIWFVIYLVVTTLRVMLVNFYKDLKVPEKSIRLWCNLYILGAVLAGISWGLSAIILFPYVSAVQQTLLVLMIAGVTAGAIPMSSAIPGASILFLFFSLMPYIMVIAMMKNSTYLLFDVAVFIYLIYSIILSINTYKVIVNSIILTFENDALLDSITEAKKQLEITNKKLELAATHDPLTKVANRSLFQKNLANALVRASKNKAILALLYLDFDHLKPINDLYGHNAGDFFLQGAIEKLIDFLGDTNMIARLGGDEFTIILENMDDVDMISAIAQQICQLLATPVKLNETELQSSASIGISLYPSDGTNVETLLWVADQTMYYVKEHGGNNFYFYKDLVHLGR